MPLVQSSWDKVIYSEEKKKNLQTVRETRPAALPYSTATSYAYRVQHVPGHERKERKNHALLFLSPNSSLRLSLQRAQSRFFLGPP
jgi:hypothetical protein